MSSEREYIIDSTQSKRMVLELIRSIEGPHRVTVVRHRKRRSDRQNRYYWPCFVQSLADYLRGQGWDGTDDDAHEILKAKWLRVSVVDRETGEVMEHVRSTTTLDTVEFNEYLDKCAMWLNETFGIQVPEPDTYHETEDNEECVHVGGGRNLNNSHAERKEVQYGTSR